MNRIYKTLEKNKKIFHKILKLAGNKEIFLVGGSIRDLLLNKESLDFDFAVPLNGVNFAKKVAEELHSAFIPLDLDNDEARVVYRKSLIMDFKGYKKDIIEDLKERDFTINAIALPLKEVLKWKAKFIDPFNGISHLKRRVLKPVTKEIFNKDPLRLLRAFRFSCELDLEISPQVYDLMKNVSLKNIAKERIGYEFMRILQTASSYPVVKKLAQLEILQELFPPAERFFADKEIFDHSMLVLLYTEEILENKRPFETLKPYIESLDLRKKALIKLASLFHDVAKPDTKVVIKGEHHFYGHDVKGARLTQKMVKEYLRLPKRETESIKNMIARHMHLHLLATGPELTERAIRRFLRLTQDDLIGVLVIDFADGLGTAGRVRHLEEVTKKILEIKEHDEKLKKFKRLITGYDLIDMGLKPGPLFKVILEEIEELQLEGKLKTKEEAIQYIKDVIEREKWKF